MQLSCYLNSVLRCAAWLCFHCLLQMEAGTAPCFSSSMHATELLAHHYSALCYLCLALNQLL